MKVILGNHEIIGYIRFDGNEVEMGVPENLREIFSDAADKGKSTPDDGLKYIISLIRAFMESRAVYFVWEEEDDPWKDQVITELDLNGDFP